MSAPPSDTLLQMPDYLFYATLRFGHVKWKAGQRQMFVEFVIESFREPIRLRIDKRHLAAAVFFAVDEHLVHVGLIDASFQISILRV